jgi:hypothetical protein
VPPPKDWPFYKPVSPEVPVVDAQDRVANEIDAFVLAKLEATGLTFAASASKQTIVRRLYFDLIGLPPRPEEVQSFVSDADPDAYEKLVDQLLADPRYGERWARFWLDLARYADTAGYEGDPDLPHAWRYRDYVIDSLNRDKRYDTFIKEQIAGDEFDEIMGAGEIPLAKPEQIVAMTFLRLAPFTEPRGDETRHEMLSEMTSTTASVFLGLTVGCAKCHDHKYDGIPIKDFYRMKAFFNTVQIMPPERGDSFQIGGSLSADFYRKGEKDWAAGKRAQIEGMKSEFENLSAELKKRSGTKSNGAGFGLQSMADGNDYIFDRCGINDGKLHSVTVTSDGKAWEFYTDGKKASSTGSRAGSNRGQWFSVLQNPTSIDLGQYTEGSGLPKGNDHRGLFAEILIYDHPLDDNERAQVDHYFRGKYYGDEKSELPESGLRFRLDAADYQDGAWVDRIGGIRLSQNDPQKQPTPEKIGDAMALRFDGDFLSGDVRGAKFLGDNKGTVVFVLSVDHQHEGYGFAVGGGGKFISSFVYPGAEDTAEIDLINWVNDSANQNITAAERERFHELRGKIPFVKQHLKRLRPQAMSLRHSFGPPYESGVPTTRVMIRGEYDNPGEAVEAGFLSCITGNQEPAEIRLDPFKRWPTRSRRMALAEWIASADNPLTARVMMNRLWFRHFGRGIVATPSDFGKLGGEPSHPELLDWLAVKFVAGGWSLKKMHRLMVTSSTYRQSSQRATPDRDPDNLLLSHFNRRRLEAEAVRDLVLAASGRLNPEMFGLPIFPPLPDDIAERVKFNNSKWATDHGPEGRKRSLYIYQQRTLTMPFMQTFDGLVCEDTMPRRQTSVTPLQALAMYNSEFVNTEARHFAKRIAQEAGDDPEKRVARAVAIAFGREATTEEIAQLKRYAGSEEKLVGLARILYNASEFVYVD